MTHALAFLAGFLACALWLTCHEPEPRVAPLAAYQLALDAGIIDGLDAMTPCAVYEFAGPGVIRGVECRSHDADAEGC